MANVAAMWRVLSDNQAVAMEREEVAVEFKAKKKALEKAASHPGAAGHMYTRHYSSCHNQRANPLKPGQALTQHAIVQQLVQLMNR
jgi:hypothetical protein